MDLAALLLLAASTTSTAQAAPESNTPSFWLAASTYAGESNTSLVGTADLHFAELAPYFTVGGGYSLSNNDQPDSGVAVVGTGADAFDFSRNVDFGARAEGLAWYMAQDHTFALSGTLGLVARYNVGSLTWELEGGIGGTYEIKKNKENKTSPLLYVGLTFQIPTD